MVYNRGDLRENRFEIVEWGDGTVRSSRRERLSENATPVERKNKLISSGIVIVSTVVALGIAVTVAFTLVGPMPEPKRVGANQLDGMGSLPSLTTAKQPTSYPTVAKSNMPSIEATNIPSASPSDMISMVPSTTPTMICVDEPGVFANHAGDHVTCEWFQSVNTYSFVNNCGKTDLGKACLFSCRHYNSCIIATVSPSSQPTSTVSPSISLRPTHGPRNNITLLATSDAMVNEGAPNTTLGSSSWLKIFAASAIPDLPGDTSSFVRDSSNSSSPSIAELVRSHNNSSESKSIAEMVRDYSVHLSSPANSSNSSNLESSETARGFIHHSVDDGAFHVLIRFDISMLDDTRSISSASLLLTAANSCGSGIYLTQTATNWNETSISWENAPSGDGPEINRLYNITHGQLYPINVTSVFTMPTRQRQKALSFRLYPIGVQECLFVSKENQNGNGPKLQIVYNDI